MKRKITGFPKLWPFLFNSIYYEHKTVNMIQIKNGHLTILVSQTMNSRAKADNRRFCSTGKSRSDHWHQVIIIIISYNKRWLKANQSIGVTFGEGFMPSGFSEKSSIYETQCHPANIQLELCTFSDGYSIQFVDSYDVSAHVIKRAHVVPRSYELTLLRLR